MLLRLVLRPILSILLVAVLHLLLPQYFVIDGTIESIVGIGLIFFLFNLTVRPIVNLIALPFTFLFGFVASAIVHLIALGLLVELTERIGNQWNLSLAIEGGLWGWLIVAIALALGNSILRRV